MQFIFRKFRAKECNNGLDVMVWLFYFMNFVYLLLYAFVGKNLYEGKQEEHNAEWELNAMRNMEVER